MRGHFSSRALAALLVAFLLLITAGVTAAQGGVEATTRDNATLRSGPGRDFASLGIVPFNTTLPATGRNDDNSWIQVNHNGTSGWIAAFLLNWTGDVNSLPLGGAQAAPAVPAASGAAPVPAGALTGTTRSNLNVRGTPSTNGALLGQLPANTTVALTGRWGAGAQAWVRFDFNGQVGWLASWLLNLSGDVNSLADVQAEQAAQAASLAAAQASLPTVCAGGTVPQAAAYVPGPGVHAAVIYNENGTVHNWNSSLGAWGSGGGLNTQLVICVSPQSANMIQECQYRSMSGGYAPSIFRYIYAVNARVIVAQTGQVIAGTTLTGSAPRECRANEPWSLTRLDGGSVTFDMLRQWLQPVVAP